MIVIYMRAGRLTDKDDFVKDTVFRLTRSAAPPNLCP